MGVGHRISGGDGGGTLLKARSIHGSHFCQKIAIAKLRGNVLVTSARQSLDIISGEVMGEDQVGGYDEEEAAEFLVGCPTRVGGWLASFDDFAVAGEWVDGSRLEVGPHRLPLDWQAPCAQNVNIKEGRLVRVISLKMLRAFWQRYPDAESPLRYWFKIVQGADWGSLAQVRRTFRSADPVRVASGNSVVIFDVGGNKYRVVAAIHYNTGRLYVLRVMTHRDYDRETWKVQL